MDNLFYIVYYNIKDGNWKEEGFETLEEAKAFAKDHIEEQPYITHLEDSRESYDEDGGFEPFIIWSFNDENIGDHIQCVLVEDELVEETPENYEDTWGDYLQYLSDEEVDEEVLFNDYLTDFEDATPEIEEISVGEDVRPFEDKCCMHDHKDGECCGNCFKVFCINVKDCDGADVRLKVVGNHKEVTEEEVINWANDYLECGATVSPCGCISEDEFKTISSMEDPDSDFFILEETRCEEKIVEEFFDDDIFNIDDFAESMLKDLDDEELVEHINKENPPIESTQELRGKDNAVVDCEVNDIITHSKDEKPLDCKMRKKPLDKPLTEELEGEEEEKKEDDNLVQCIYCLDWTDRDECSETYDHDFICNSCRPKVEKKVSIKFLGENITNCKRCRKLEDFDIDGMIEVLESYERNNL